MFVFWLNACNQNFHWDIFCILMCDASAGDMFFLFLLTSIAISSVFRCSSTQFAKIRFVGHIDQIFDDVFTGRTAGSTSQSQALSSLFVRNELQIEFHLAACF